MGETPSISVVIATYERPELCARAVASALAQDPPPLEVLICDDGSSREVRAELTHLGEAHDRVRFLPATAHSGTPAGPRNTGLRAATGDWVAFLDDDDQWLPHKLGVQAPLLERDGVDVLAADARRSDGRPYLGLTAPSRPRRADILRHNPVILSSAIVRRSLLSALRGFPVDAALTGIEDYCAWLTLGGCGARFLVLPDVLVAYTTHGERLSDRMVERQLALARHVFDRWRVRPLDRELAVASLTHGARWVKVAARQGMAARRSSAAER